MYNNATEKQKEEVKALNAIVVRKTASGSYQIGYCKGRASNEKEYTEVEY